MKNKSLSKNLFFSRTHDFLEMYLPAQAGKSLKTVKAYKDALSVFRKYVHEENGYSIMDFRYEDCTYEFILYFSKYLTEKKDYAPSSVNQRLAAIKSYLRYAADCDICIQQIYFNVMNVPFITVPKLNRPIIENDALKDMLEAPGNNKFGIRDRMMLVLLFDAAIRLDELLSLKLSSLNLQAETPYIRVLGKGNKERIVSIRKATSGHVKRYIQMFHKNETDLSQYFFYTVIHDKRNKMSERNAERIVKKYADIIREKHPNLPDNVYPHMFRRTRATGLYRDGVDIELISRILGHASTQTTRIYTIPSLEMLKEAMEKGVEADDHEALWKGHEDELAALCGLR